jgi:hypothetical protein
MFLDDNNQRSFTEDVIFQFAFVYLVIIFQLH